MPIRTFLALDLDDSILDGFEEVRSRVDDQQAKIRWVARENLHLTLHFLGDVADEQIPEVSQLCTESAAQVAPFDFEVRDIICVPPRGQLRMIWVGIVDPSGQMSDLHGRLTDGLRARDFRVETRPFKPHITLARIKYAPNPDSIREAASIYRERDFGTQHVSELVTYSSKLTPTGPVYTALTRATLGK